MALIQLEGTRQFAVPPERLYDELADLPKLVQTLPDVKTVKEVSADHAVIVVAPGLSFLKGELETTINRISATPPSQATLNIASKGIGTTVKVQADFTLSAKDAGTQLHWQAQVTELGGLVKLVPTSLLKGAAQKVIDGWLNSLEQRLS